MYSFTFFQKRTKTLLSHLVFTRPMGGGPRTFPGGINKWQWKRLHEKKAMEKERKLLDQEKQLYQARIRSEIRANLVPSPASSSDHLPMSSKDHVKSLADRFLKDGAEDLWNEDDGPLKCPQPPVVDLQNSENSHGTDYTRPQNISNNMRVRNYYSASGSCVGFLKASSELVKLNHAFGPRFFSVKPGRRFRRNESSGSDNDSDYDVLEDVPKKFSRSQRDGEVDMMLGGRGSLGKYDVKFTKRSLPQKELDELAFSMPVEMIRNELKKKKLMESEDVGPDQESLLSKKRFCSDLIYSGLRFDECGISPLTVKALSEAGYVQMTRVQEASISVGLEGKDALVKAKTGTGKSAAFLVPAIEAVVNALGTKNNQRLSPIYVLILCPTRELASQLAAETKVMLKYHSDIGVQTLVGGTRFKLDQKHLESEPCQILVATPGRLLDHIESKSGFSARLMGLRMLVLDEADHLLDLGFRKDVERIVDCLPRRRQSFLFSATMPKEVRRVSQLVLNRDHVYIDMVGVGCVETHSTVRQSYLVAPHQQQFEMFLHLLNKHCSERVNYKVIVFCTTAMMTSLMYLLLREMKMNVREIHSRKPQLCRTRVSDEFKESTRLILVTSDVSSRGMNYPDVTLVMQVGVPPDREHYIHRLGRTGREGKDGEGILLLAPWEEYFLNEIRDLPLDKCPLPPLEPNMNRKLEEALSKIDPSVKESAYHAWLGYYNSIREISRDKTTLAELANQFSQSIGLQKSPPLFRKTALKMGLKDIPGILVRN
ncbi:unnamed protein product [Rhodiola kirilowii]